MRIYHPASAEEAVRLRHELESSQYIAGGTEIMRLGSSISCDSLIDVTALSLSGIRREGDEIIIGALTPLEDIRISDIVPAFIREAAASAASLQLRNMATIGGCFALRRTDSYKIPALLAAEADVDIMCTEGPKRKTAAAYFGKTGCRALLLAFRIRAGRTGENRRIARSSHAHAAVTGAVSEGTYAYAVSGSGVAWGGKESWKDIAFADDLTGSADYKRYLASVLF